MYLKNNEIFKTPKKVYHVTSPITDVVYHESKSGKFDRKKIQYFQNGVLKMKKI